MLEVREGDTIWYKHEGVIHEKQDWVVVGFHPKFDIPVIAYLVQPDFYVSGVARFSPRNIPTELWKHYTVRAPGGYEKGGMATLMKNRKERIAGGGVKDQVFDMASNRLFVNAKRAARIKELEEELARLKEEFVGSD